MLRNGRGGFPRRQPLLRYKVDVISVITVVGALALQLWAAVGNRPWFMLFPVLLLARSAVLVQHNHAHLTVFTVPAFNEVLGWICRLSSGVPLEFYRVHHVANHHRYNQLFTDKGQDWSSLFAFDTAEFPSRPVPKWYYVLSFPIITVCSCLIAMLRHPHSGSLRRFLTGELAIIPICGFLCYVNPGGFALFFALPWALVAFAHGRNNYRQHVGCTPNDPFNCANEGLSVLGKGLGFNIGYHIEHHLEPALHWTQLPKLHETIKHRIPPERFSLL